MSVPNLCPVCKRPVRRSRLIADPLVNDPLVVETIDENDETVCYHRHCWDIALEETT